MAFQYKTLIRIAPAALLILAFQNCSPQKFAQTTAASEKSFADGTGEIPADDSSDDSSDDPTHQHDGDCDHDGDGKSDDKKSDDKKSDDKKSDDKKSDDKKSSTQTESQKYAANCKEKLAQLESFGAIPQDMPLISSQGSANVGTQYVSHVGEIRAVGSSEIYVVGAKGVKMVKADAVSLVGSSKVILCGVYPVSPSVKGSAQLHVIGAVVAGAPEVVGSAKLKVYDADGNPL